MGVGQPQVRESAWLYAPVDDLVPIAHVRLEERVDGGGWDLYLASPASGPSQHVNWPDEADARRELARVYEDGQAWGEWRVHRHGS